MENTWQSKMVALHKIFDDVARRVDYANSALLIDPLILYIYFEAPA